MSLQFRVILIIAAFLTALSILQRIRKEKVQIQYSIFWILLSALLIVLAVFPDILIRLARMLGMGSPSNLVFLITIFLLLVKCFNFSVEISTLETRIKELTQKIALKEEEEQNAVPDKTDS